MPDSGSSASDGQWAAAVSRTRRLMGTGGLILLGCSWKLWTPHTGFPQIPWFRWAVAAPPALDWSALLLLLVCGLVLAIGPAVSRVPAQGSNARIHWPLYGLLLGFVLQVCLDQQRGQVWCYQLSLFAAILLSAASDAQAVLCLRWMIVGIYFHSGLSKCDQAFIATYGQQLVEAAIGQAGLTLQFQSETVRRCLAAALPLGELGIACGLIHPRTRRISLFAATAMHALLLAALGPGGLHHRPTVLVWNAYFVVQVWTLFGQPRSKSAPEPSMLVACVSRFRSRETGSVVCRAVAVLAVLLPFLEPWEYFDQWPSWALYAARSPRVALLIDPEAEQHIPEHLRPYLAPTRRTDGRLRLDLARWSLSQLDVPIYPQRRFQLAVALAVVRADHLQSAIRVELFSPADRWTGTRSVQHIDDVHHLTRECRRFLVNTQPRRP